MEKDYNQLVSTANLKNEIKELIKTEFDRSVKSVCSEEESKKIPNLSEGFSEYVSKNVIERISNPLRQVKLSILYEHEKNLLNTLKEYKEEIKFATSLQAEIRKEAATFFSSTLKEVCSSLKETQVDPKCQAQWILDLVRSYTSSLNLSSKLAEEHVISLVGDIEEEIKENVTDITKKE